jgi:hypothetical protein
MHDLLFLTHSGRESIIEPLYHVRSAPDMLASIHDVPKPRGFHHIMSDVLAEHDCNTKRKKHFASWVNKCSRSIYGVKYIYISS